jgi:hypothetical protein
MLTMSADKIQKLCDKQDRLQEEYLKVAYSMNTSLCSVYCRYEAATLQELAQGEKYWRRSYPPSYRAFLQQQNGWLRFGLGWTLVGVPRAENKRHFGEVDKALRQIPVVTSADERRVLGERQKRDTKVILPTEHMAIGTDFNYAVLVFDQYRISRSEEPEVVWVRHGIHVEERWKTFEAFVRDAVARTQRNLTQLKSAPSLADRAAPREVASRKKAGRKLKSSQV